MSWYETFLLVANENIGIMIAVVVFVLVAWAGLRRKKK